jgi:hypothetical protein
MPKISCLLFHQKTNNNGGGSNEDSSGQVDEQENSFYSVGFIICLFSWVHDRYPVVWASY